MLMLELAKHFKLFISTWKILFLKQLLKFLSYKESQSLILIIPQKIEDVFILSLFVRLIFYSHL